LFDAVERSSPDAIDCAAELSDYRWFDGASADGQEAADGARERAVTR
jgi:hypothetical protein